jgi:hypothetical protein
MCVKMYLNMLELLHLFSSTFGEVHVQECVVGQVWWSTVDDGSGHVQREVGVDFAVQRCRGVPCRLLARSTGKSDRRNLCGLRDVGGSTDGSWKLCLDCEIGSNIGASQSKLGLCAIPEMGRDHIYPGSDRGYG